jgi:hypothetical protein
MINGDLITCRRERREMQFTISQCHTRTISIIFAATALIYKMHCTFHSKWKILKKKNSVWHVKNFLDAVQSEHTHTCSQLSCSSSNEKLKEIFMYVTFISNKNCQECFGPTSLWVEMTISPQEQHPFVFHQVPSFFLISCPSVTQLRVLIWSQKEFFILFPFRPETFSELSCCYGNEKDFQTFYMKNFKLSTILFVDRLVCQFFPNTSFNLRTVRSSLKSSTTSTHTRKCSIYNWSNLEKIKFSIFHRSSSSFVLDVNDVHEFDSVMSIWLNSISGENDNDDEWVDRHRWGGGG